MQKKQTTVIFYIDHLVDSIEYNGQPTPEQAEQFNQAISSAIQTELARSIESLDLLFRESDRETGIEAKPSKVALRPLRSRKYNPRKYDRGAFGTLFGKLESAVKSGNIQDQMSYLAALDALQRITHRKTGTRVLSRTQFLSAVQHLLELAGLSLDTRVQSSYRYSSRHNSGAKA